MSKISCPIYFLIFAFLLIAFTNPVLSQITIEPYGFALSIAEGENNEVEIVISNTGDDPVVFEINYEAEFRMLAFNPEIGEIAGQDIDGIVVNIIPEDAEACVYEFEVEIHITDPDEEEGAPAIIPISAVISIASPTGSLTGVISSSRDGELIPNASIRTDRYDIVRYSDEQGEYAFTDLPAGDYEFTISADDFLNQTFEVNIEAEEVELDFELPQAECAIDPVEIVTQLDPGQVIPFNIVVSNTGNGPLTYTTERHSMSEFAPWEVREAIPFGEILEDDGVRGTIFTNDMFYVARRNHRNPMISVLNRDRELIREFAQPNREGGYGFTDLAFDGEWIWGGGTHEITALNLDGEVMRDFDGPFNPNQYFAWDSEQELLWVSSITSPISSIDRDGNEIDELDGLDFRIHGLAFYEDDPDGYQLYIFHHNNRVAGPIVYKMNTATGDTLYVTNIVEESFDVAYITNEYDNHDWVFLMHHYDQDAEYHHGNSILQFEGRRDWMSIDPEEGVIEAGEAGEFELTINEIDLPEGDYEGEIVFIHDGVAGETYLPVSLEVGEGDDPGEVVLNLEQGWNMVSVNIQPDPDDVTEITADLVEAGSLILMKNGMGQFYFPGQNFNGIPGWFVDQGYLINMARADELTIIGDPVRWNQPIQLEEGWQIISYYPNRVVEAPLALSGVVNALRLAKDNHGQFYSPEFRFNNMGDMAPGQGYMVDMLRDVELVYTIREGVADNSSPYPEPSLFPIHPNTGENMSLLVQSNALYGEIGVYANGNLVGSGVIQNGRCGIAVWGDNPMTPEIDGALNGYVLEFLLQDGSGFHTCQVEPISGDLQYVTDGFQVVQLLEIIEPPEQFGIMDVHPNPFNSTASLTYNLSEPARVKIALFDISGRLVKDILSDNGQAGVHTISVDGSELSSGIYIVQIYANERIAKRKLTLIK